jgi:Domain of unknown function (DUF1737)
MNKVTDYRILRGNAETLEQLVLQALSAGWSLQGGPSFGAGSYMQAIVRVASERAGMGSHGTSTADKDSVSRSI